MARPLANVLKDEGVQMDVTSRQLLADTFHAMYPSWNDEDLMHNPSHAVDFCAVIRQRTNCPTLPERIILRALSGMRKQSMAA